MEIDLIKIEKYMNANELSINKDKTNIMIIAIDKKKIRDEFNIRVNDKTIRHSNNIKVLRNTLNYRLN